VGGVTRGYGAHNAIFVPAFTMHGFVMLGQVFGSAVFLPRDGSLAWPDRPLHLRLREARGQAELTGLIETLEREAGQDDMASQRALYHQAGLLSVMLERLSHLPDLFGSTPKETASDRLATAFASLVERDYRTPKTIAAYAAELGVTPTHLTRACKQSCGRGALDIVADRKLYDARRRLSDGAEPVKDIAASLGFASAAYFTRAFRAGTGQSPSEFRRKTA
jgi:AraC-like DNA-binding protein